MSAFGLSSAGKDAKGALSELPRWLQDIFEQQAGAGKDESVFGRDLRNSYLADLQRRADEGIGSTDYIRGVGESILPGLRGAQDRLRTRQEGIESANAGMTSAAELDNRISGALDSFGTGINQTGDTIAGDIQDTFGRNSGRGEAGHRDVVGNIKDTFGGLTKAAGGAYGGMKADTAGTFSDVRGMTGSAYDETGQLIDTMDPEGKAAQARASRSFEPAMASMALRLRKAGVEAGSPEFDAAMRTVESDRARAMDDASIGERDKFVSAKGQNILGKAGALGNLDLGRLAATTGLSKDEEAIQRALGLGQGEAFRGEAIRNTDQQIALDQQRSQDSIKNLNTTQDRSADYWKAKAAQPLATAQLEQQQFGRGVDVANRGDAADAQSVGYDQLGFNTGMGYTTTDRGYRDAAQDTKGQVGQGAINNANVLTQIGLGAANQAGQGYGRAYDAENASSNWAGKFLGGLAGSAAQIGLGALTGGMSNMIGGIARQVPRGGASTNVGNVFGFAR